ncbi:MAG: pyrroloquinoline-quinone synthase PqqC [Methylacidiphilales bacterium]|nr:pyrroloquinoline-quinone synthase PqqC [Candidatus Methylacidiphilales bacterium]
MTESLWNRDTFIGKLREVGNRSYHDKHPFHVLMNAGKLSPEAIRGWVINRFYYQTNIPVKDAAILGNCPFHEIRRLWTYRIIEHDGTQGEEGGIEAWIRLGTACGIAREEMLAGNQVAPAVRFAVDAYVHFCREKPWIVAMASSLTELFAPDLMAKRLESFQVNYKWVQPWGFDYFQRRLTQARKDSDGALALTLQYCNTPELQRAAVDALIFKCDLLWAVLDGIHHKYGPGTGE